MPCTLKNSTIISKKKSTIKNIGNVRSNELAKKELSNKFKLIKKDTFDFQGKENLLNKLRRSNNLGTYERKNNILDKYEKIKT